MEELGVVLQEQKARWPRGLDRANAAEFVGVGTTFFDEMVRDGRMPKPKEINGGVKRDLTVARLCHCILLCCVLPLVLQPQPSYPAVIQSGERDGVPWIVIVGEILPDDEKVFESVASGLTEAVVVLESPGGATLAAINIGKAIRSKGFATLILEDGTCTSACAMIWLAGTLRFLHPDATLAFHASYISDNGQLRESGVGNALVGAYYNSLGLSDMAVMYLTLAPPEAYLELDHQTAAILGIEVENLADPPKSEAITLLRDIDLYGYDYQRWNNASLERCQRKCEDDGRCMAFTFNRKHSVCFLKSDAQLGLHNDIAVSGYKPPVQSKIYLSNMEVLEGLDLPGGDFGNFRGSFGDCFVACSNNPNCRAFSWVHQANSCWLKDEITGRRARRGVTSGTKVRD